ncbi:MAG: PilN domain-containing protein [bacterium]
MAQSKLSQNINLLSPSFAPKTTWDKVYDWVFLAGRYIIVLVELVVLIALGSRFYFDRKNNDFSESIRAKTLILDSMSETENEIKGAQQALNNVAIMLTKQKTKSDLLSNIEANIPSSIVLQGMSLSDESISITGESFGYTYIETLENNFKQDASWTDVNVTLTSSGSDRNVSFTMSAKYSGAQVSGTD